MVDLAGSEKTFSISTNSKVKEESININRSLFYLRKVISALSEGKSVSHVPYRDSKLTCLLKNSLGGKGACLMVSKI
jgi:kinesin family protein 4/21/27